MGLFEHEVEFELSAAAMWLTFKDQNTILPEILPEFIASIVIFEGPLPGPDVPPGAKPGAERTITFGPLVPGGGYVKERIVSLDIEGLTVVTEEFEGGHLVQFGFTKWVQTMKFISTGESTSKLVVTAEFEGGSEESITASNEATKKGITHTFKALEQYAKSHA